MPPQDPQLWRPHGIVIIILPMILVYVLFQRQFIKGLTAGALK